jgi:hypothetical protein
VNGGRGRFRRLSFTCLSVSPELSLAATRCGANGVVACVLWLAGEQERKEGEEVRDANNLIFFLKWCGDSKILGWGSLKPGGD